MIFNSISREIHKNSFDKYQTISDKNKYFPNQYTPQHPTTNSNIIPSVKRDENPSKISQMNEQIAQNIAFLRYKDTKRIHDLKSSQISHKSNHSSQSSRSYRFSPSKSTNSFKQQQNQIITQIKSPLAQNLIPTKQEYMRTQYTQFKQPQKSNNIKIVRPENIKIQQSNIIRNYYVPQSKYNDKVHQNTLLKNYQSSFLNQRSHNQLSQFTKKSVILENKPDLYRSSGTFQQIDRPSKDNQDQLTHSMHSNYSDKFSTFSKQLKFLQKRDISALILSNQDANMKSQIRQTSPKMGSAQAAIKIQDSDEKQKDKPSIVSPLPQKSKRNTSLIVSAGLIAMGIFIFLLQILK